MAGLNLTIALERYDRHIPLFMGSVKPPAGLTLKMLEVGMSHPGRDGVARHERFLQNNEFDIAETSLSSHVIATSRGAPFVGIPVFPRRLFSQNHIFVNRSAGKAHPWLAPAIMAMWEESKAQSREFYDDPGYAQLAFCPQRV
ncbi:MAG: hypothetical protein WA633_07450 [Stellaceae bacterium]